jgi:hypothetical protein
MGVGRAIRHDFGGKLSEDELRFAVSKALAELTPDAVLPAWANAPIHSLEQLHRVSSLGTAARVQARIIGRSSTQLIRRPGRETSDDHVEEVVSLTLEDRQGSRMETLDVSGPDLIDKIDQALRAGTFADLLGFAVPPRVREVVASADLLIDRSQ